MIMKKTILIIIMLFGIIMLSNFVYGNTISVDSKRYSYGYEDWGDYSGFQELRDYTTGVLNGAAIGLNEIVGFQNSTGTSRFYNYRGVPIFLTENITDAVYGNFTFVISDINVECGNFDIVFTAPTTYTYYNVINNMSLITNTNFSSTDGEGTYTYQFNINGLSMLNRDDSSYIGVLTSFDYNNDSTVIDSCNLDTYLRIDITKIDYSDVSSIEKNINIFDADDLSTELNYLCTMNDYSVYSNENSLYWYYDDAYDNLLSCTKSGYSTLSSILINETPHEYNFTVIKNQLSLTFSEMTSGVIIDNNLTRAVFNNTGVLLSNLSYEGDYVRVYFNPITAFFGMWVGNFTQQYMFANDGNAIIDNIKIIDTLLAEDMFIEVYGTDNMLLRNARVRLYQAPINDSTGTIFQLIGQVYTVDGMTGFKYDMTKTLLIDVTAPGYRTFTDNIGLMDTLRYNGFTTPYKIYLREDLFNGYYDRLQVYLPDTFNDRSRTIYGAIFAPASGIVQFNTDYKTVLQTRPDSGRGIYQFQIQPDDEFDMTGESNITVNIYISGVLERTQVIKYIVPDSVMVIPSNLKQGYLNLALIIVLLTLVVLMNHISADQWGTPVYLAGCVLLSLISTSFLWLAVIVLAHYIFKGLFGLVFR